MELLYVGSNTDPFYFQLINNCPPATRIHCWDTSKGARDSRLAFGDAPFPQLLQQEVQSGAINLGNINRVLLREARGVTNDLRLEPDYFSHYATQWNTAAGLLLEVLSESGRLVDLRTSGEAILPLEALTPAVSLTSTVVETGEQRQFRLQSQFAPFKSAVPPALGLTYLRPGTPHESQALVRCIGDKHQWWTLEGQVLEQTGLPNHVLRLARAMHQATGVSVAALLVSYDKLTAQLDAVARGLADDVVPVQPFEVSALFEHFLSESTKC